MRRFLVLLPVLTLQACGAPPPPYNVPPATPVNEAYACADGQSPVVRFFPDGKATIRLNPDRAVELAQAPAASGARYEGSGVVFWSKGREATLEMDGRQTTCRRTPSD